MKTNRRASALMVALIALVVTGLVAGELLRLVILQERASRDTVSRRQAQILAQSALDRALLMVESSPDYSGETWDASAAPQPMQAEINVIDKRIEIVARVGSSPRGAAYRLDHILGEKP